MRACPHMIIFPSIFISLTMLAFNFLGDALRDALDPKMR
jgi:oligopeptide transport system permease protein